MQVGTLHQHGRQHRGQQFRRDDARHPPDATAATALDARSSAVAARDVHTDEVEAEIADAGEQAVQLGLVGEPA